MGYRSVNGCGACGGFWKWFKPPHHNFFNRECDKHDILSTLGGDHKDRYKADLILFQDMTKHVTEHFSGRKPISKLWFYILCVIYFIGVRIFGHTRFNYKTTIMNKILDFLFRFYKKHYGKYNSDKSISRVGTFKIAGLFIFAIIMFSLGAGANGDTGGIAINMISSHLLTLITMVVVNRLKPNLFDNRSELVLAVAVATPLYLVSWLFGGLSKLSTNANKENT